MPRQPLRVVFDAHAITPHRSGIGEYSVKLLEALCMNAAQDVVIFLYANGAITPMQHVDDIVRLTQNISDGSLYALRHQWELPLLLRKERYDLLHMPDFFVPPALPIPYVCTIYDLIPLVRPEFISRSLKVRLLPLYRLIVRRSVQRARRVLTISEHSRNDIVRMLGADVSGIDVTALAPTVHPRTEGFPAVLAERLSIGRYLLYVGRHDPYKGLGLLLEAFASVASHPDLQGIQLAVAGSRDPRYDHATTASGLGLTDRVVFLDYVDSATLSALYTHALAFVFPSMYEGFGLPPLDAMVHGTPVLCSNRSSLPEVCGNAALLFDPEDIQAFASALLQISGNASLREDLARRGTQRQKLFSWADTATLTLEAYRKATFNHGRV